MQPVDLLSDLPGTPPGAVADGDLRRCLGTIDRRLADLGVCLDRISVVVERLGGEAGDGSGLGDDRPWYDESVGPGGTGTAVGGAGLMLLLLGPVQLLHGGRIVAMHRRSKTEAVLKVLALSPGRRIASDALAGTVWPEQAPQEARHSLQTTVSDVRRTLRRHDCAADLVRGEGNAYALDPDVVTDVGLFDAGYRHGLGLERAHQFGRAAAAFGDALAMYRDDLEVDEFAEIKMVVERERLSAIQLTILGKLGDYYFRLGQWDECLHYAAKLLARDPGREDAHRSIIRCYLRLGQRARALRQYELCRRIVRELFDVEPEPETVRLRDEIVSRSRSAGGGAPPSVGAEDGWRG